ncbi:pentapeptide repeat-containing protein [Actinosynnema sp. NPDC050801]|uniref:pentapeptide repeat-containing protein n=1 Tax=unclassified Actinosynnema TaxID=2637065 RepID=UPI0033C8508A
MPLPTPSTPRTPLEPMPRRVIATVATLIATATVGLVVALWWAGTAGLSGAELVNARFNALRTGLSIGVGGGGIFALYLAWRRQHATEIGLVQKERDQADVARAYELQRETAEHTRLHAERVAATTEHDAEERRITDLYAKSVEQLGSDKAPVRHGGLYALERLAQDNTALRQIVVNVLCAYLRTPFDLPSELPDDSDRAARDENREQIQEREVRLTAQRILTAHLNPSNGIDYSTRTFWKDIDLDLTGAVLIDWHMSGCLVRKATFRRTTFIGDARFAKVHFTGNVRFNEATFTGDAQFNEATFVGDARFTKATIIKNAWFSGATFTEVTWFNGVTFAETTQFSETRFSKNVWFNGAIFTRDAWFSRVTFTGDVRFHAARFTGEARFNEAIFTWVALLGGARFTEEVWLDRATFRHLPFESSLNRSSWPTGWRLSSEHQAIEDREGTWHHLLKVEPGPDESTSESAGD